MIFPRTGPEQVRVYNTINPYFNVIHHLNKKLEEDLGFSITSAIIGWDDYIKSIQHVSFIGESYNLDLDLTIKPRLEIDKQCLFIKKSDARIEEFKENLKNQVLSQISSLISVTYNDIIRYIAYVNDQNYTEMILFLEQLRFDNIETVDFWLRLTDCPYLEEIDFYDYELTFNEQSLLSIMTKSKNVIIEIIITLKQTIEGLDEDHFSDYNHNELLSEIISKT